MGGILYLSFSDAMTLLTGEKGHAPLPIAKPQNDPPKEFVLLSASSSMRRVFGYLLGTRKLDREVLTAFVREKLIYEDLPYHNAVFVGTDEKGVARHAHKRSTNSEGVMACVGWDLFTRMTGLPHRAKAVYLYLQDRADAQGVCWPSLGNFPFPVLP